MFPGEITYLLDRAAGFGNHYRKYIQAIRDIFPLLPDSLWKDDSSVTVAFTFPGKNYFRDMKHLKALTNDRRLCLNFLGCYYAVQFLWLNVFMSDWFDYQLDKTRSPQNVYRQFILTLGKRFRRLSAVYMHFLIEILKEDRQLPRFVITGVGTRSDQDDIDVGIIDDGSESRQWLNRVIGKMNLEMTRFASHFHFHLSEHVGNQAYSASIPEYRNLLQEQIGSFVILTEMLGAAFIVGDKSLFIEFEQKVTDRYFYRRKPNRFHEGYLRGILGEIIDLAAEPFDEYRINPKQDGLRIIKNVVYAYKTRLNIREVNPWRILREIKRAYPGLRKEFRILENSLTFLEIFRYLYQQLVVQEETIAIGDGAIRQNLQEIAYQLGYRDFGPHQAVHHLLQDYRNAVQEYRSVLPVLIRDLSAHLKENSVLREVILPRRSPDHSVLDLLEKLKFFQSVHYWEDFFQLLRNSASRFVKSFVDDLNRLSPEEQARVSDTLARWTENHPEFIIKFCMILKEQYPLEEYCQINNIMSVYLSLYKNDADFLQNLIFLLQKNPTLIFKILQECDRENLKVLEKVVSRKLITRKSRTYRETLLALLEVVKISSHYFMRFLSNVYEEYPGYAFHVWQPEQFRRECNQIINRLPFVDSLEEKKNILGIYYDLKYLQIGLETFKGLPVEEINRQFGDFTTRYFQELFRICLQQTVTPKRISPKMVGNLAVYASGGMGRGQAFDDDFDLVIIADTTNENEKNLIREIISSMNTEIIKRGTLPHFRFSHYFGEYFCPFSQLKEMLRSEYPECFIDKSQLLEARFLVGGTVIHKRFLKEIIRETIFDAPQLYIPKMVEEIRKRHGSTTFFRERCANIKECTGGIRDIDMIILIYKVCYSLLGTNPYKLIGQFIRKDPRLEEKWQQIKNTLLFLQRFRYVYRLSIAAENEIYADKLENVAERMFPDSSYSDDKTDLLWQQFVFHRRQAWNAIRYLIRLVE